MIDSHLEAIAGALAGERVRHILVTHTHLDHSPLSRPLQARLGGEILAYGPHGAGKAEEGVHVEEGGDRDFAPDRRLKDGEVLSLPGATLTCLFTPGHTSNHMCFALEEERAVFTGDHVMGWSTSVIVPPDGDMAAYMRSLDKLLVEDAAVLWPTHGPPVHEVRPFLEAFIEHRHAREEAILECLHTGRTGIGVIVARLYAGVDKRLHPAAAMSVLAHLDKLIAEGRARAGSEPGTYRAV